MKCCTEELKLQTGKQNGQDLVYYQCAICGKKGKGKNQKEAEKNFNNSEPANVTAGSPRTATNAIITELAVIPKTNIAIDAWFESNMQVMIYNSSPIQEKPATERMLRKNVKYVKKLILDSKFKKVTGTVDGMESITDAFGDAIEMGATLGEMGDIVPYGKTGEFIPNIECFEFVLTVGKKAPFEDIHFIPIHKNDIWNDKGENGNFIFTHKRNLPRGECIGIAVFGTRLDVNKIVGEIYDEPYLMQKARDHSPGYKAYILEKEDFKRLEIEGKLKTDSSGRKFMEKKIEYQKDGQKKSFTKEIYEHDITNPYDNSDKVKMLIKSAGKSFFGKYIKIRNAMEMSDEWDGETENESTFEQSADNVLDKAMGQFVTPDIKDAEIIPDEKPTTGGEEKTNNSKKDLKNNEGGLFNEDE